MDYILKENIPDCHEDSICGSFSTLTLAELAMKQKQGETKMDGNACWVTSSDGKSVYACLKTDAEKLASSSDSANWHQDMIGVCSVSYSIIVCPRNKVGNY